MLRNKVITMKYFRITWCLGKIFFSKAYSKCCNFISSRVLYGFLLMQLHFLCIREVFKNQIWLVKRKSNITTENSVNWSIFCQWLLCVSFRWFSLISWWLRMLLCSFWTWTMSYWKCWSSCLKTCGTKVCAQNSLPTEGCCSNCCWRT